MNQVSPLMALRMKGPWWLMPCTPGTSISKSLERTRGYWGRCSLQFSHFGGGVLRWYRDRPSKWLGKSAVGQVRPSIRSVVFIEGYERSSVICQGVARIERHTTDLTYSKTFSFFEILKYFHI